MSHDEPKTEVYRVKPTKLNQLLFLRRLADDAQSYSELVTTWESGEHWLRLGWHIDWQETDRRRANRLP